MPTLATTDIRAEVANNRQYDEERFAAWEFLRWQRDEITDQAERLAAPMENSFNYRLTPEGLVTDLGEPFLPVFEDGYKVAKHNAQFDKRWEFEATRREIELEEQLQIQQFASGEIDAEALIVLSPCPDAVRLHGVDIGAYDKNRLKMMTRVVTRTDDGVRITSLSLDKSNYRGMQAIATSLGYSLPDQRPGSEDILRNRLWLNIPVKSHKNLVDLVRDSYDASLSEQFGGQWFAGRNSISVKDAMAFIELQPDLLEAHMKIVSDVFASTQDKNQRNKLLKDHRYNYSAALDDALHGKQVESLGDAGAQARAEGKEFVGDCAVSGTAPASEQAEALGYTLVGPKEILKCVNCPFCKKLVDAVKRNTAGEKSIECRSCFAKVDLQTGERLDKRKRKTKKIGNFARLQSVKAEKKLQHGEVVEMGQAKLRYEEQIKVGGTKAEYVDLQTGARTDNLAA